MPVWKLLRQSGQLFATLAELRYFTGLKELWHLLLSQILMIQLAHLGLKSTLL